MAAAVDYAPPRAALWAGAVIVAATFTAAVVARNTDVGTFHMAESEVVQTRLLRITNAADFTATVTDAADGALLLVAKPGLPDGFIWGAVNGLSYGRKLVGAGPEAPYELARGADGRLTLTDTATGQKARLNAFGSGNAAAWGRLLERKEVAR